MRCALLLLVLAACREKAGDVERLLAALRRGDAEGQAVRELGPDAADALPKLTALLAQDRRRFVQLALIDAIEGVGETGGGPALAAALDHIDPLVRAAAARAHWNLLRAPEPGLRFLLDAVAASDPAGRRIAAKEFARVQRPPAEAVAELAAADGPGRADALEALAGLGPAAGAALPAVRAALADADLRLVAARALVRLGGKPDEALGAVLPLLGSDSVFARGDAAAVLRDLAKRAPAEVARALAELLDTGNAPARASAAYLIGELKKADAKTRARLAELAEKDPAPEVRDAAATALRKP